MATSAEDESSYWRATAPIITQKLNVSCHLYFAQTEDIWLTSALKGKRALSLMMNHEARHSHGTSKARGQALI